MISVRKITIEGEIAIVPLTRGYSAIIDAADVPVVSGRNWSALVSKRREVVYACRVQDRKMILMHRAIIGAVTGEEVDHCNGDGLNNRRNNLRLCTRSQNNCNSRTRSDNRSGLKGALFETRSGKWRAEISVNGRRKNLGLFATAEEAHARYVLAASEVYGEFARAS